MIDPDAFDKIIKSLLKFYAIIALIICTTTSVNTFLNFILTNQ